MWSLYLTTLFPGQSESSKRLTCTCAHPFTRNICMMSVTSVNSDQSDRLTWTSAGNKYHKAFHFEGFISCLMQENVPLAIHE